MTAVLIPREFARLGPGGRALLVGALGRAYPPTPPAAPARAPRPEPAPLPRRAERHAAEVGPASGCGPAAAPPARPPAASALGLAAVSVLVLALAVSVASGLRAFAVLDGRPLAAPAAVGLVTASRTGPGAPSP